MKKLIALIACISVFACMSVSALAGAPAGSDTNISYTEATESASGYFTIDASDVATGNTQTTIVVIDGVKTTDENGVEKYNISTDTIQYINQQDTASFTVIPKDHDTYLESATEKTLTVLIGGDNITRKELGTITYAAASGGEETQYNFTVNTGITGNPYGIENAKIIRISDLTTEDVVTLTIDEDTYTSKYYTATDGSIIHIIPVVTAEEITNDMFSIAAGTPDIALFGDTKVSSIVDTADVTMLAQSDAGITARNGTIMAPPTDFDELIIWDVNGDGVINTADVTLLAQSDAGITSRSGAVMSVETMAAYAKK